MDAHEWARRVEQHVQKWEERVNEIPLSRWQDAMAANDDRVGSWHRMTRRQRAIARVKGRLRRIIRAVKGED